ncbi:MAG TPA: hypothetical protein VKA69_12800 [Desulfobacteria bacterium]|nr:hypothetical protein [Desulfobacteria bacterium]
MGSPNENPKKSKTKVSTAEAFHLLFCALSKRDRLTVARLILQDQEIRKSIENLETPNETTLNAFNENKAEMPSFGTIEELRQDLL